MVKYEQRFVKEGKVMKQVKILHCADLHFDTPFKELTKEISQNSKEELLQVFKNIIDLTINEKVQVLLIAGDVFDNLTVNKNTLFFISNQLKRIENVRVFISPGNHDPYNEKSFYNMINWPDNVYIFKGKMQSKEIEELNLVVWGAGFNNNYEHEGLINEINIDKSKINIMVIHGEIESGNSKNEYNPIYLRDIEKTGIEYVALGHRHKFSGILKSGNTNYAYSGCPQGRGFDEEGERGIIIGDIYKGGVSLNFKSICKRKYITREVQIDDINTYDELISKILSLGNEEELKRNFYKIILKGKVKEHFTLKENILMEKVKDNFYYIKFIDKTIIGMNINEFSMDFSIRGRFVTKIIKMIQKSNDEEEKNILQNALKLGMQCLSEEEVSLNDY